ncbi:glycosyltransferase family 2 protein [Humidesulfovibrio idahonensis]
MSCQNRVIVVIPVLDEEPTIASLVRAILAMGLPVVVVNDTSGDRSAAIAREAGARVLDLPWRMGAWGAAQTGICLGLREGYGRIITIDGDGQHDPQDIARLLAPFSTGEADIIIGSCTERGSAARRIAWRFFRTLTGLKTKDFTSGYRAYNRKAARCLLNDEATLADYQDLGVLLAARRHGLRIMEIPVDMRQRGAGKSHIFSSWLKVTQYLVYTFAIACMRR